VCGMEEGASSLTRFPPGLRGALDAMIQEYKRIAEQRAQFDLDKVVTSNTILSLQERLKDAEAQVSALTKKVQILEEALIAARAGGSPRPKPVSPRVIQALPGEKAKSVPNLGSAAILSGGPGKEKLKQMLEQMGYKLPEAKVIEPPSSTGTVITSMIDQTTCEISGQALVSTEPDRFQEKKIVESNDEEDDSIQGREASKTIAERDSALSGKSGIILSKEEEQEVLTINLKGGVPGISRSMGKKLQAAKEDSLKSTSKTKLGWIPSEATNSVTGKKLWKQKSVLNNHMDSVRSIAFIGESDYLLSSSDDGSVKMWNLQSNVDVHTFFGHENIVTKVLPCVSLGIFLSGSADSKIYVWALPIGLTDP